MATRPTYPIAVEQKTCAWRYNGALRLYQRDYIELFLYEVSLKHVASSWSTLLLDNEWLPINQHWLYGDQAGCVETTLHKARVKRNEIVEIIASKCPSRMSLIWIWRSGGPAVFSTHNLFCCRWLRLASPICSLFFSFSCISLFIWDFLSLQWSPNIYIFSFKYEISFEVHLKQVPERWLKIV